MTLMFHWHEVLSMLLIVTSLAYVAGVRWPPMSSQDDDIVMGVVATLVLGVLGGVVSLITRLWMM